MCGASDAAPVAWSGAEGLDVRSDVGRRRLLAPSDWKKRRRVVLDIESPRPQHRHWDQAKKPSHKPAARFAMRANACERACRGVRGTKPLGLRLVSAPLARSTRSCGACTSSTQGALPNSPIREALPRVRSLR